MKVEEIKLAFENNQKIELGLIQDINLDLNTVANSLTSLRPNLIKTEDILIKNIKVLDDIENAIKRVETTAKDLGADAFLKEIEKPKILVKEFRNTTNNTLKAVQSAVANL